MAYPPQIVVINSAMIFVSPNGITLKIMTDCDSEFNNNYSQNFWELH